MTSVTTQPAAGGASPSIRPALPWTSWAFLLAAGVIAFRPLSITWNDNPDYSYGWWIPLLSLFLFAERWPARPPRAPDGSAVRLALGLVMWGLLFLVFRLAAETDPDWRPGIWMLITLYIGVLHGWLWLYGGASWARYFAFPICFLFLSLPWFFGIEYPLTQGLMRWNAIMVAHALKWLGIFAEPAGNIIQLQNCQLGVEEACSGILSLQASLMMGCLLGEIYRLTFRRRIVLVLAAMALALIGNFLRTLFLGFMAFYSGSDAVTRWHDTAGYSILAFTAIGAWLTALSLDTGAVTVPPVSGTTDPVNGVPQRTQTALRLAVIVCVITVLAEVATQTWFAWRESSLSRHPEWTANFPKSDSYQDIAMSDVTLTALRCDLSKAGQWRDGQGLNWTTYWLKYNPKPYTRIVLGWHTPDNCLPDVGLIKDRDYPPFAASVNGINFYIQPKKFLSKDGPVYVFWVIYPLRGDRPADTDTRLALPFATKFRSHLHDVWTGYRGVGVETLETAIMGASSYEAAQADYLDGLKTLVVHGASPEVVPTGTSH